MNKDSLQTQQIPSKSPSAKVPPAVVDADRIGDVKDFILNASKKLINILQVDRNNIVATADISGWSSLDREIGSLILEKVLQDKFGIFLSPDVLVRIKAGKFIEIEEPSVDKRLPSRVLEISLARQNFVFSVRGHLAKNGEDGYSVLGFDWKRRPGQFDESGYVDLKKLNNYPAIDQDAVLATIYHATPGDSGVTCFGKMIRQESGHALRVKWNERLVCKVESSDNPELFQLVARSNGIVNFALLAKDDPKTLVKLDVADKIIIPGDVNYGVGDLGKIDDEDVACPANLVIKGRVRGAFSLQSNGFIHVKDTIEGKSVIAREVKAEFIANGCKVEALELVEATVIANASVTAQKIIIKKTSNNSELFAREEICFNKGATGLSLKIATQYANFEKVVFSGGNDIVMGKDLFPELQNQIKTKDVMAGQAEQFVSALKPLAAAILTDIGRVQEVLKKSGVKASQSLKEEFISLKNEMIKLLNAKEVISINKIREDCYRFQTMLGEENFHESILRKVETMVKNTKKYLELQTEFVKLSKAESQAEEAIKHLKNEISINLFLAFDGCTLHGATAELRVSCGQAEKIISCDQFPPGPFRLRYKPPGGLQDLDKIDQGRLVLEEGKS